jgi:hypothetical protein
LYASILFVLFLVVGWAGEGGRWRVMLDRSMCVNENLWREYSFYSYEKIDPLYAHQWCPIVNWRWEIIFEAKLHYMMRGSH